MTETPDIEAKQENIDDKTKVPCPYWLEMIPYFFTFLILSYISWRWIDVEKPAWRYPLFCSIFAACCILQWCYILWERWHFYGSNGFYEIYWYCHMGLLLTAVAIYLHLPSLLGQTMCLTLFPHVSFWVDLALYPCFGRSIIGSSGWLVDKSYPVHEKMSSMHHFWYYPCIIFVLQGQKTIPLVCYYLSIVQFVIMNFFSHFMTPNSYIDKNGKLRQLNICVSHECVDILKNIPPFKWGDGKPYIVFLLIATVCYNIPVNFLAWYAITCIQLLMNSFIHLHVCCLIIAWYGFRLDSSSRLNIICQNKHFHNLYTISMAKS